MKKAVIVIGLGNTLMSDEGVGVRVVQKLLDFADSFPQINFVDAGTGGMSILHLIDERDKAFFIDCAKMGKEPGDIKKFTPQEIKSIKALSHQSLHEVDLIKIINMADKLGQCPAEIIIFGIEPQSVKPGCELSKTVSDRLDEYVNTIHKELLKIISSP
ncbi:MAG: HyaD/HybD family hydrogenase maturation endopeptidase [Phycisphaerae bacterium]|nr:HyaD/HybD family hydrogenase maturation endopeptidase [Phycisphaerae bacterium]MDD5381936.1 HyaD/HybD family hydrogenase maturation endopeptidase [Phycisphaerae bacterium]